MIRMRGRMRRERASSVIAREMAVAATMERCFEGQDTWSREARLALALAAERGITLDLNDLIWQDVRDLHALQHRLAHQRGNPAQAA